MLGLNPRKHPSMNNTLDCRWNQGVEKLQLVVGTMQFPIGTQDDNLNSSCWNIAVSIQVGVRIDMSGTVVTDSYIPTCEISVMKPAPIAHAAQLCFIAPHHCHTFVSAYCLIYHMSGCTVNSL